MLPLIHSWSAALVTSDVAPCVLVTEPMAVHKALMFRQWSAGVVLFAGGHQLEPQQRDELEALDVAMVFAGALGSPRRGMPK
ncbi:hypothetical protein [Micromonospora carbonacea]|uniref:hypothetical protein n=1 Tax=Micromonospora carbonacea TaxID=47853 RepID=UPI003710F21D